MLDFYSLVVVGVVVVDVVAIWKQLHFFLIYFHLRFLKIFVGVVVSSS